MFKHGGNRREVAEYYGIDESKIIDFSVNINHIVPGKIIQKAIDNACHNICAYPDPEYKRLYSSLSDIYSISSDNIAAGNGSAESIHLLPAVFKFRKVLIIQPNFSEYELSCIKWNCETIFINGNEDNNFKVEVESVKSAIKGCDAVFLSNPNNPSGYLYSRDELNELLTVCEHNRCYLFIDEVFLDFVEDNDKITMIDSCRKSEFIFILKSLTKIYSVPGIRMGFLVSSEKNTSFLRSFSCPWNINVFSEMLCIELSRNIEYVIRLNQKTLTDLKMQRTFLINELSKIESIKVYPGEANYLLCKNESSIRPDEFYERLAKNKIIVRHCGNYHGLDESFFRVAVKDKKSNTKLIKSIKDLLDAGEEYVC